MRIDQEKIDLARHFILKAKNMYDDALILKNVDR